MDKIHVEFPGRRKGTRNFLMFIIKPTRFLSQNEEIRKKYYIEFRRLIMSYLDFVMGFVSKSDGIVAETERWWSCDSGGIGTVTVLGWWRS